ncbi:MAG: hypothetical protein JW715_06075 [Sedimentisphaerales bacterium]|nr:hypothetical protein [Sedimentisphaerales bacterium]
MKTPLDDDLNQVYEVFHKDHELLREKLITSLPAHTKRQNQSGFVNIVRIFFGGSTMKIRMTKIATAALITIAVIVGIRGFNGTTAWAKVIKAFNSADNIYIFSKFYRPDDDVWEVRSWLKNRMMLRQESPREITIDNGENRLTLDRDQMTAQLSDSVSPFEDYMESGNFEIILLFSGKETPFKAKELTDERTDTRRVFEITYRDVWSGKAWVDAKNNLPLRIKATYNEEFRDRVLDMEVTYNYEPIPVEVFDLDVPSDYKQLPRLQTRFFSGKVIDEKGEPVAGAEIVTSDENIRGKTNEKGEFAIKLHPGPGRTVHGFPMIIRAVESSDPNHVAWTLLRNPRHELRPLFIPDDGKTKLEQGGDVDIRLVDDEKLREFIPGNPGRMIFKSDEDKYPSEVKDIELRMQAASVITGKITDRQGQPITNAVVKLEYMNVVVGQNEIDIRSLGKTNKESEISSSLDDDGLWRKTFAVTDSNGNYKLGNLPDVWSEVRLEAQVKGFVTEAKRFFRQEQCNFSLLRADTIIRGTVIDNLGEPLVGREVEFDIDSDEVGDVDMEEVFTDSQGRFELAGVPAVDDLVLEIRTDEKPRDWNENELTRGRQFIYYLMIEEPIKFEPGKKEYFVKIVPHRPDITLEIEVKDSKGNLLAGVPAGVGSPGFSERQWYITKLVGKTDVNGICTITEAPRIEPLQLWICMPGTGTFRDWESMQELDQQLKDDINESRGKYLPKVVTVELEKGKNKYEIPVTLEAID